MFAELRRARAERSRIRHPRSSPRPRRRWFCNSQPDATALLDDKRATTRIQGIRELVATPKKDARAWAEVATVLAAYIPGLERRREQLAPAATSRSAPDEVRVALSALGAIQTGDVHPADLSGAGGLRRLVLVRANFRDAVLSGADLEGSILEDVHLEGALLTRTNLRDAVLRKVAVDGATFFGAICPARHFTMSILERADLGSTMWTSARRGRRTFRPGPLPRGVRCLSGARGRPGAPGWPARAFSCRPAAGC